jgi:hypothetical protein
MSKTSKTTTSPSRSSFAAALADHHREMKDAKVALARRRFVEAATAKGWDVRTRDGLDDYFEERTFYAWLGFRAAATGGAL